MDLRERIKREKQKKKFKAPPANMLSAIQWAEKWNMDVRRARVILVQGIKLGMVKMENFNVFYIDGRVHHCPHYAEIIPKRR